MKLVFKRSVLIEVYRSVHHIIENNFYLTNRTLRHSQPKMLATLRKLSTYIQEKTPHTYMKGRTAKYEVQDVVNEGFAKIFESADLIKINDEDVGVHEVQATGVDIGVS